MGDADGYGFDAAFERVVAVLCVGCPRFWQRIGRDLEPDRFGDPASRRVLSAVRAIAIESGHPPSSPVVVAQRIRALLEQGKVSRSDAAAAREIALDAAEGGNGTSEEQVVAELTTVLRRRAEKAALDESLRAYGQRRDLAPVVQMLERAARIGAVDTSIGTVLDAASVALIDRLAKVRRLPIGIEELDTFLRGGPPRGTYSVFVGGTGSGKSMTLGHGFAHCLATQVPAAYATMEVSEEVLVSRIVGNLTELPSEEVEDMAATRAMAMQRMKVLAALRLLGFGTIKYFTPRTTTVTDIRAWVEEEERVRGLEIPAVFVDYASLLGSVKRKDRRHEEIESVTEDLRSWAIDRQKWVWSAGQVKAEAENKKKVSRVGIEHAGGSKAVADTSDLFVTLNYDDEEEMMRFYVGKYRSGRGMAEIGPIPTDFRHGRVVAVDRRALGWPF